MAEIKTELDLLIAEREHVEAVAALKAASQANPSDKNIQAQYRAAKLAHREFRHTWRTIRRAQQDAAVASGDPAAVAALVGEGGAIAAPAAHGMGVTPGEVN